MIRMWRWWRYLKKVEPRLDKTIKLFYTLMFLPLAISMIALIFFLDLIPAHNNIKNEIDRWGNKYEILIILIIIILLGHFLLFMRK